MLELSYQNREPVRPGLFTAKWPLGGIADVVGDYSEREGGVDLHFVGSENESGRTGV